MSCGWYQAERKAVMISHLWSGGHNQPRSCPRCGRRSAPVSVLSVPSLHTQLLVAELIAKCAPPESGNAIKCEWTQWPASFWMCPWIAASIVAVILSRSSGAKVCLNSFNPFFSQRTGLFHIGPECTVCILWCFVTPCWGHFKALWYFPFPLRGEGLTLLTELCRESAAL